MRADSGTLGNTLFKQLSLLELDLVTGSTSIEQRAVEGRHPCPTGSGVKPGSKQMRLQDVLLNDSLTPLSLGFGPDAEPGTCSLALLSHLWKSLLV